MSTDKPQASTDQNAVVDKTPMRSIDAVGITFVNGVVGRGYWNGVINIQLGAFQFTVTKDASQVDTDLVVCSRLRMDIPAARELRDAISAQLEELERQRQEAMAAAASAADSPVPEMADATKLN